MAVVTGTRAEYADLKPIIEEIAERDDLRYQLVVTGMHLSPQHGQTIDDIIDDGFTVDRTVHMLLAGDSGGAMAKSLGVGLSGLAEALIHLEPDIVLVSGDRGEAFAAAVAAAHMSIPVAHIHGGDVTHGATIDESIRHGLTRFANLHFPGSKLSASRLIRMGEAEWRVTLAGAPALQPIQDEEYTPPETVREKFRLPLERPVGLVIQHPLTTEPERAGQQMRETLEAVTSFDMEVIVIYPNSDAGSDRIRHVIENYQERGELRAFKNVPRHDFLGLLATTAVLVGNSSCGVIEAPSFDLPVVNLGLRQEGREKAEYVLNETHRSDEIEAAIERCLTDGSLQERAAASENPYDFGSASRRIADRLASVELGETLLRKQLHLQEETG